MDLGTVTDHVVRPDLGGWEPGDVWLAGGTALFADPRPARRLLDLTTLGWPPLVASAAGLEIAATCTLAELEAFTPPTEWVGAALVGPCVRAFLGSFKIWNAASVGGNLCLGLPSAPMIALAVALEGEVQLWTGSGAGFAERRVPVLDFVTGNGETDLRPGEVLRALRLPASALTSPTAFAHASSAPLGPSAALLAGRLAPEGFVLTVTAATPRPVRLEFSGMPSGPEMAGELAEAVPPGLCLDDGHGSRRWRRHLVLRLAEEIRLELLGAAS